MQHDHADGSAPTTYAQELHRVWHYLRRLRQRAAVQEAAEEEHLLEALVQGLHMAPQERAVGSATDEVPPR